MKSKSIHFYGRNISLLLILLFLQKTGIKAQAADSSWIYRPVYEVFGQSAEDSTLFNTAVYIELNQIMIPDSSTIVLKLGSVEGESDLYYKEYLNTPELLNNAEVERREGYLRFGMGRFALPENHLPAVVEILVR